MRVFLGMVGSYRDCARVYKINTIFYVMSLHCYNSVTIPGV